MKNKDWSLQKEHCIKKIAGKRMIENLQENVMKAHSKHITEFVYIFLQWHKIALKCTNEILSHTNSHLVLLLRIAMLVTETNVIFSTSIISL